ncbi:Alpha/Beta hydrolase protein [Linnemannia elongata]|nr:Alpha/Beta hydrolase protein [Linnemannia elongata]
MLVNTTTFLASQVRNSLSATVQSTNAIYISLKSTLGLATSSSSSNDHSQVLSDVDQHQHGQQQRSQSQSRHAQYPSLQSPWRGLLENRIKQNYEYTMPVVSSCYSAPRHPIVLCHGLFGFDKMGPDTIPYLQIHYWKGIQKALTKLGAKVIVASVPKTGSIKRRAEALHRMLTNTVEGMHVNFLAHSMGGLDCRYLISHIHNKNYDVKSLTTLSTPHRGSPVMDWFRDSIGVGHLQHAEEEAMRKLGEAARLSKAAALDLQEALRAFQTAEESNTSFDTTTVPPPFSYSSQYTSTGSFAGPPPPPPSQSSGNPIISPLLNRLIPYLDTPAYANLTTDYCQNVFNPNTPDDPRVSYYSYGAAVKQIPVWAPLGIPWEIIKAKEGENDGLVSTHSARWGHYVGTEDADHWDLNNRYRLKIGYEQKPFDAIDFYMNIATLMYKEGH